MMSAGASEPYVCIDCFPIGATAQLRAHERACQERPDNDRSGVLTRLALDSQRYWQTGRELRIRFLDGSRALHQAVLTVASEWTLYANLSLVDVTDEEQSPAELRIAFAKYPASVSWSRIGTDALLITASEPTMHLGAAAAGTSTRQACGAVLHEFGHALGFVHEHQSPASAIPWNRAALKSFYGGAPNFWTDEQIEHNVIGRYSSSASQYTAFDPHSIMLYPIPKELTDGVFESRANYALSATDRAFVAQVYPRS
jgi:hypothetical protein